MGSKLTLLVAKSLYWRISEKNTIFTILTQAISQNAIYDYQNIGHTKVCSLECLCVCFSRETSSVKYKTYSVKCGWLNSMSIHYKV